MQKTRVWSPGWEDPLEEEMATHSSILAWKIPWPEDPGRLQSMGLQRVGHMIEQLNWTELSNTHPKVLKELTEAITESLNIIYEFYEDAVPLIAISHHLPFRTGKDNSKSNEPITLTSWPMDFQPCSPEPIKIHTELASLFFNHFGGGGLVAKSCRTVCDPMDCSPSGSSAHGIFQARTLEWVVISSSRGSSQPGDWTHISWVAGGFFNSESGGNNFTSNVILIF